MIKYYFRNDTFEKKNHNNDRSCFDQLLSYNVVSKHKNKNENTIPWHVHMIQKSHFSPVWVMEFSIISSCLSKVKVFPITVTFNLSRRSTFA